MSAIVRTVVEAMTALPDILAGLFIYVTLIIGLGCPAQPASRRPWRWPS